jgi:hypothetical protein
VLRDADDALSTSPWVAVAALIPMLILASAIRLCADNEACRRSPASPVALVCRLCMHVPSLQTPLLQRGQRAGALHVQTQQCKLPA